MGVGGEARRDVWNVPDRPDAPPGLQFVEATRRFGGPEGLAGRTEAQTENTHQKRARSEESQIDNAHPKTTSSSLKKRAAAQRARRRPIVLAEWGRPASDSVSKPGRMRRRTT